MRTIVGVVVLVLALVIAIAGVRGTQGQLWATVFGTGKPSTPAATSTATVGPQTPTTSGPPQQGATQGLALNDSAAMTAQGTYALAA